MADKALVERLRTLIRQLEIEKAGTDRSHKRLNTFFKQDPETQDGKQVSTSYIEPAEPIKVVDGFGFKIFRTTYSQGSLPYFQPVSGSLLDGLKSLNPHVKEPKEWLFLDIETTGLAGAATIPFLVGFGRWNDRNFEINQYFLLSRESEPEMMAQVRHLMSGHDVVVTFNGKSFDLPILNSRFIVTGVGPPILPFAHLDLFNLAKVFGKHPKFGFGLKDSVARFAGTKRYDDISGRVIPALYFIYERDGDVSVLDPVFRHNRLDIVDMVCLVRIFASILSGKHLGHFLALGGAGKLHFRKGNLNLARKCLEAFVKEARDFCVSHELAQEYYRKSRLLAHVMRRQGDWEKAKDIWLRLISSGYARYQDYLWLARYYELIQKDIEHALILIEECIGQLRKQHLPIPKPLLRRKKRLTRLIRNCALL